MIFDSDTIVTAAVVVVVVVALCMAAALVRQARVIDRQREQLAGLNNALRYWVQQCERADRYAAHLSRHRDAT